MTDAPRPSAAPLTIVLSGRRPVVLDAAGELLASLTSRLGGARFTASDAGGEPLCSGRARLAGLSATWDVASGDGTPLLTYAGGILRSRADLTFADGHRVTLQGSAWRADVVLTDAAGREVARGANGRRTGLFAPPDYVMTQAEPVLSLAELVAVATVWLTSRRNAATGAAAGAVAAGAVAASG